MSKYDVTIIGSGPGGYVECVIITAYVVDPKRDIYFSRTAKS